MGTAMVPETRDSLLAGNASGRGSGPRYNALKHRMVRFAHARALRENLFTPSDTPTERGIPA